ncbi:hypothetical protein QZH41_000996 [Actinostola sp. cb2023]|nr:hypothetical protein QZH41_000996 [Actinostola sp. cb2023]
MSETAGNNTAIPRCLFASPLTWHSSFSSNAVTVSSIATAAINGVSMPFTIMLNAFMIISIVKNSSLRQKERVMAVLYLSVTDLFTGLISQPLFIAKEISHLNNTEADCAVEEAFYTSLGVLSTASLFHLVVVAYDRHVAINQPYQYFTRITVRRLTYTSIAMWLLAVVWYGSFLLSQACPLPYKTFLNILNDIGFTTPLLVMIYWYGRIFFTLRRTKLKMQQERATRDNQVGQKKKSVSLLVILTGSFLISYLPVTVLIFRMSLTESDIRSPVHFAIFPIVETLVILNSLLNPVVFCSTTSELKKECRKFLGLATENESIAVSRHVGPQNMQLQELSVPSTRSLINR